MKKSRSKSGYFGVFRSTLRTWVVKTSVNKKFTYHGTFDCPLKAARHYDKVARELGKKNLNFPEGTDNGAA